MVKSGISLRPTVAQASEETIISKLIEEYSSITIASFNKEALLHTTTHYIETISPVIHDMVRCLAPDKLKAAKTEFQQMMKLGIIRPSKSGWSSSLHLVSKTSNTCRVCEDYRELNAVTKPNRYPVLHIQDITAVVMNKWIFIKLDLILAYHQISVEAEQQ